MPEDSITDPEDVLNKLASALTTISRGDPITALRSEIETKFSALSTRFDALDKATTLQHEDLVRVPTQVDRAVVSLRELVEQKIETVVAKRSVAVAHDIEKLKGDVAVSDERFKGIQVQFTLLKQATEQLDLANKTAIAAALQAQKESAGETQKSSQAAIAKSEASMLEAIRALTATFNAAIGSATGRIDDLKGRMDRNEGQSNIADPATVETLRALQASLQNQATAINALGSRSEKMEGRDSGFGIMWGVVVAVVGIALVVVPMLLNRPSGLENTNSAAITKLELLMEQHAKEAAITRALPPSLSGGR